jgi:hypothetical protein
MNEPAAADLQASGILSGSALLLRKLADPFAAEEIQWKPGQVKGDRALALAYINTRAVMDRLDDVLGPDSWEDRYEVLASGDVVCTLKCRVGERWVRKSDVGGPSEQPDGGDRIKAAFSDAFKRAAVKFGIGRYIARLPRMWVDYDVANRRIKIPPTIPPKYLPTVQSDRRQQPPAATSQLRGTGRPVVAGIPRITADECERLAKQLKASNISLQSVLQHYDITRLDDLPADQFKTVIDRADKLISEKAAQPV